MARTKKVLVTIDEAQLLDFKEVSRRFTKHFGIPVTLSGLIRSSLWNYSVMMEHLMENFDKTWTREKVAEHFMRLAEKQQMKKEKA